MNWRGWLQDWRENKTRHSRIKAIDRQVKQIRRQVVAYWTKDGALDESGCSKSISKQTDDLLNERISLDQLGLLYRATRYGIEVPDDKFLPTSPGDRRRFLTDIGKRWLQQELWKFFFGRAKDVVAVATPILGLIVAILSMLVSILSLLVALRKH